VLTRGAGMATYAANRQLGRQCPRSHLVIGITHVREQAMKLVSHTGPIAAVLRAEFRLVVNQLREKQDGEGDATRHWARSTAAAKATSG
jgi:hypothetical protein